MKASRFPIVLSSICILLCATVAASAQNFGSVKLGDSATATITVTISTAGTVGSISVRLLGAENKDFTNAGGGTCAVGNTYAAKATCTVNVAFAPKYAGWRQGAIVLFAQPNATGSVLANTPINGTGSGPQIAFPSAGPIVFDPSLNIGNWPVTQGLSVDGAGNLFVADAGGNRIIEVPPNGGDPIYISPTVDGAGLNWPCGAAVDGAGNLFITDENSNRVVEVPVGGAAPSLVNTSANGIPLNDPAMVAIDGAGNLYVPDAYNQRVVKVPADGSAPTAIAPIVGGSGLAFTAGVAVNGAGDLFISDWKGGRIVKVPADGSAPIAIDPTVNGASLNGPQGMGIDAAGNLFVADSNNNRIVEIPGDGSAAIAINPVVNGQVLAHPLDTTLDAAGNLFIGDFNNNRVVEIPRAQPPQLTFAQTNAGATSTDSPQSASIQNIGNQPLGFSALSYPTDFPEAPGTGCTASTPLATGQTCNIHVDFSPLVGGQLSESITITDNSLNLADSTQNIAVSGTSLPGSKAQTITFAALPNVVLGEAPITLKATATSGRTVNFSVAGPATVAGSTLTVTGGGSISVTASQPGDATYAAAPPVTHSFTVLLPSTVKVQTSALSATLGWPVTFTATLSGSGAPPTGTITFYSGSTSLGPATVSAGVATLSTSALALGPHSITAKYSGNKTYSAAASTSITQLVTDAPTLTLAAAPNPVNLYSTLNLTATVENPTGSAMPTGQVKFFVDFQPIGFSTLSGGVATMKTSTLTPGQHYIAMEYLGDTNYQYLRDVVQRVWVDKLPVTVSIASPGPQGGAGGESITLTATINPPKGMPAPTGTIYFYSTNTVIGQATISGNQATFSTNSVGGETIYTFTALFWGDSNYLSARSNIYSVLIP